MKKSISDQYQLLKEGKLTESVFLRNVKMSLPKLISNTNSFFDAVKILKNRGLINEAESKQNLNPNPQQYDLGMRYESEKGFDFEKCNKIVLKNLESDSAYYTNLHLSGYNEDSMKKDRKKRTDLPVEVKKDNFKDELNKSKKVKFDKLTEDEIKVMIGGIINELTYAEQNSLKNKEREDKDEVSKKTTYSIQELTYDKCVELVGKSNFMMDGHQSGSNVRINDEGDFNYYKEKIITKFGEDIKMYLKTNPYNSIRFVDQKDNDDYHSGVKNFLDSENGKYTTD